MKTLFKTKKHHTYYSNRVDIINNLLLFRLLCFVSIILLSCEKKNDYCSVCVNNEIIPKEEVFLLQDSMRVSFMNYWKDIDSLEVNTNQYISYFFEDLRNFYQFNSFAIHLSNHESLESFEDYLYTSFVVYGVDVDEDISKEITKTINDIDYKILVFMNSHEISLKAYGKCHDDFFFNLSTGFYKPTEDSLTQIENKKEELVGDLLNRLYCVLSTIEITPTLTK
jgi:hypothetical protein